MEKIQFTNKQKEKLIEMSRFLYPEYTEIHINGAWVYFNKGIIPLDSIPIFEFCMTHLANKLFENTKVNRDSKYYDLYNIIHQCYEDEFDHIIDYLYHEFKN